MLDTSMKRLFCIIIDAGVVIIFLITKLLPAKMRDSILDGLFHPVRFAPLSHIKEATGAPHPAEKINCNKRCLLE